MIFFGILLFVGIVLGPVALSFYIMDRLNWKLFGYEIDPMSVYIILFIDLAFAAQLVYWLDLDKY